MSAPQDDGYDISAVRDVGYDYGVRGGNGHEDVSRTQASDARAAEPAVTIVLSKEAQAALERIKRSEQTDNTQRAERSAREIAAAAGVSDATAKQAAQPMRSPPPAKGAALFRANLEASVKSPKE